MKGGEYLCKKTKERNRSVCWSRFVNQSLPSVACEYCLRALETAEENARRLSALPALSLPHPELCKVRPELHQACPHCQVPHAVPSPRQGLLTCLIFNLSLSVKIFSCPGHLGCPSAHRKRDEAGTLGMIIEDISDPLRCGSLLKRLFGFKKSFHAN